MARALVRNLMTPVNDCVVVRLGDTVVRLKQELRAKGHRSAIVTSEGDGKVVGVITVTDLRQADDEDFVSDHYQHPAFTIEPDRPISVGRKLLDEHGNHQLIVVNDNDEPLGILWDYVAFLGGNDLSEKKSEK